MRQGSPAGAHTECFEWRSDVTAVGVVKDMSFLVITLGGLLLFSSLIMILLVLIQRGRGGGLAGAFGGMGGQSALGVRAGDVFTKITVVVAVLWVLLAGFLGIAMRSETEARIAGTQLELAEGEDEAGTDGTDGSGADVPATKTAEDDESGAEGATPAEGTEPETDAQPSDEAKSPPTEAGETSEGVKEPAGESETPEPKDGEPAAEAAEKPDADPAKDGDEATDSPADKQPE